MGAILRRPREEGLGLVGGFEYGRARRMRERGLWVYVYLFADG